MTSIRGSWTTTWQSWPSARPEPRRNPGPCRGVTPAGNTWRPTPCRWWAHARAAVGRSPQPTGGRPARRRSPGTSGCSCWPPPSISDGGWSKASDLCSPDPGRGFEAAGRVSGPHGLWRSLVSASVWGTEGPEFKSRQPDRQIPRLNRHFAVSGVSRRTAEVRSGREQAARRWKWRPGQSTSGRMPPGNGPEASRCWTTRPRRSMIPRLSSMWPVWSGPQSHRATRPSTMASMDST